MHTDNKHSLDDQKARKQALTTTDSFIVQAPAGSGKTELLIQRFLALLGEVQENPEEILAITFTRKAATEMRQRILLALKNAQTTRHPPPSAHAATTWQLAKRALARNEQAHWNLLENPNRLSITTIDGFCNRLNSQMPLRSQINTQATLSEYPEQHYQQAARDFLASLEGTTPWSKPLTQLLTALDNNYKQIENLFIMMLANREQWLPYLLGHPHHAALRQAFEATLQELILRAEKKCVDTITNDLFQEIIALFTFATQNKTSDPELESSPFQRWQDIAQFLLTKKNEFRKTCDKRLGFPPQAREMKQRMLALLTTLAHDLGDAGEVFRQSLEARLELPFPHYSDTQWQLLSDLLALLPILVGHLSLVFQETKAVDFVEIVAGASRALGDRDHPSHLALQLDYSIQHILVDEFQDTSIHHYRVLEKLIMGWQPGDGRSLFLVGDPMQSIYRFRQAEVGLFLRARTHGIGDVRLTPLTLRLNFRSTPALIAWINQSFTPLFPLRDDIQQAAVAYTAAISPEASKESLGTQESKACHVHTLTSPAANGDCIVTILTQTWALNPDAKVVILVRARQHLQSVLPVLTQAGFHYQAIDLEPLSKASIIQDLFALTRALTHLSDRTAWLAILRAPWCGLTLIDLHVIANHKPDPLTPLWASLLEFKILPLSTDAMQRLQRVVPVLEQAIENRERKALADWIKGSWYALGGPACVKAETELTKSTAYFKLLKKLTSHSPGSSLPLKNWLALLDKSLKQLYAEQNPLADGRLQIMTIHKAKGLEFDTVILLGLARKPPTTKHKLLLWMEFPEKKNSNPFILAPISAASSETTDPIYRYLQDQNTKKDRHESARLLYVAASRAKSALHLIATLAPPSKSKTFSPAIGSLLQHLWPILNQEVLASLEGSQPLNHAETTVTETLLPQTLQRLKANWVWHSSTVI